MNTYEYGKLDFIAFLQMKYIVDNQEPDYEWEIKNFGYPFELVLDDGSQSYFTFQFSEDDYADYEVKEIGRALASALGIKASI